MMKKLIKEMIIGLLLTAGILAIVEIGAIFMQWIFSSDFRTGLFIGIGSMVVIRILFKMVSE